MCLIYAPEWQKIPALSSSLFHSLFMCLLVENCEQRLLSQWDCFSSALLPGSPQIANSYLPPQARLSALTAGLWLEFRLGFHVQLTGSSSNCRHMRAEAEGKIWKRYILAKLRSKHRETVANTPKEGKKSRVLARFYQPHKKGGSVSYMLIHGNKIWVGFQFH